MYTNLFHPKGLCLVATLYTNDEDKILSSYKID